MKRWVRGRGEEVKRYHKEEDEIKREDMRARENVKKTSASHIIPTFRF